jgi:hypothetical protein
MKNSVDKNWLEIQDKINLFLEKILSGIEWEYGDCRSPFKWPARFIKKMESSSILYICEIDLEFSDHEQLIITTESPEELYIQVEKQIGKLIGKNETM